MAQVIENELAKLERSDPVLSGELEITTEKFVSIPTSRFAELIRAEHTNELIAKVIGGNLPFKYDCERKTVLDLLLGNEVSADE